MFCCTQWFIANLVSYVCRCVRRCSEINNVSLTHNLVIGNFGLVWKLIIYSQVIFFPFSSSMDHETTPSDHKIAVTHLPVPSACVLSTSLGNFRAYIFGLPQSWPDISAAAVWFIMPFLRTDNSEILNLASSVSDNKVFFTSTVSFFLVSQIWKHQDICS